MDDIVLTAPTEVISRCWHLLAESILANGSFRYPVLATRSTQGVDARVLVLRAVDPERRVLEFHTDARAGKVAQIETHGDAFWVFYDPELKLQLRVQSRAQRVTDEDAVDRIWQALSPHTQRAYAQVQNPGRVVETLRGAAPCPDVDDPQIGRANFAVVECTVEQVRWLRLSRRGHQSAVATFTDDGWSSAWVMP